MRVGCSTQSTQHFNKCIKWRNSNLLLGNRLDYITLYKDCGRLLDGGHLLEVRVNRFHTSYLYINKWHVSGIWYLRVVHCVAFFNLPPALHGVCSTKLYIICDWKKIKLDILDELTSIQLVLNSGLWAAKQLCQITVEYISYVWWNDSWPVHRV